MSRIFITNILPFYGFQHDAKDLLLGLSKQTKELWTQYSHSILSECTSVNFKFSNTLDPDKFTLVNEKEAILLIYDYWAFGRLDVVPIFPLNCNFKIKF